MNIGVITNPKSRKNKKRPHRAKELRALLGQLGEVHETKTIDSIKPVLRHFLRNKFKYWVADGGDGALHCMLRAGHEILEETEFKEAGLAFPVAVPTKSGTIDFVANNVGIKGSAEDILTSLISKISSGKRIEEVQVDTMKISGIQGLGHEEKHFKTFGFASTVGGVAQKFFTQYNKSNDPNPRTIIKVLACATAALPLTVPPFDSIRLIPTSLKNYANDLYEPMVADVWIDNVKLPTSTFTGINVGSMSIDLGGVFKFFSKADSSHQLQTILGTVSPWSILKNIPTMMLGGEFAGKGMIDRPCLNLKVVSKGEHRFTPIVDGEYYQHVKEIKFSLGPQLRFPRLND